MDAKLVPTPSLDSSSNQHDHLELPRIFWGLAATEIWERFSFYGLQGILSYYLLYSAADGGLGITSSAAVGVVGGYGAFVYLMQFAGGWLGDRLIPPRRMVLIGAVIIMCGHVCLALVDGIGGLTSGLVAIGIGTGALKTNISLVVGQVLPLNPADRDAGFSYFLMAINVGGLLGPIATGWLQSTGGFHLAFLAAALGMAFGLLVYAANYRRMPTASKSVANPVHGMGLAKPVALVTILVAAMAVSTFAGVVTAANVTYLAGAFIAICAAVVFTRLLRASTTSSIDKRRVRGFVPLWIAGVLYYGILLQMFTTMAIFITDRVNLQIGTWTIPAAWLVASASFFNVAATPALASAWKRGVLNRFGAASKIAVGLVLVSLAYVILLLSELAPGKSVSPLLVVATMAVAGISELFIGPITLSLATRIAPDTFRAQLTALGVLIIGGGAALSGALGILYTEIPTGAYLVVVGITGLTIAGVVRVGAPWIHRRIDINSSTETP